MTAREFFQLLAMLIPTILVLVVAAVCVVAPKVDAAVQSQQAETTVRGVSRAIDAAEPDPAFDPGEDGNAQSGSVSGATGRT